MDENIKNLIQLLLTNPDPDVRRGAAEELGKYEDRNALGILSIALKDENKGVVEAVSRALINIGGVDAARAIVHHIKDENISTKNLAAKLLVSLGESSIHAIIPYLHDTDKDTRKIAVDILGEIKSKDSVYYLIPLLKDTDPNVIASSLEAFGNIGSSKVIESICETFEHYPFARIIAIEALGKIGSDTARRFLENKFTQAVNSTDVDNIYLFALLDALGNLGNADTLQILLNNYSRIPIVLHDVSLHNIIQISERNNLDFKPDIKMKDDFLHALHHDNVHIQLSAVKGLVQFEDELITKQLLLALGIHEDIDCVIIANAPVRTHIFQLTVECLENASKYSSIFQLILLLGKLATEFSRSLQRIRDEEIDLDDLERAFNAVIMHWYEIRQEDWDIAINTLSRLDHNRSAIFLGSVMKEIDPWSRTLLINELANIPTSSALECIASFINDENEMVRDAVTVVLKAYNYKKITFSNNINSASTE